MWPHMLTYMLILAAGRSLGPGLECSPALIMRTLRWKAQAQDTFRQSTKQFQRESTRPPTSSEAGQGLHRAG